MPAAQVRVGLRAAWAACAAALLAGAAGCQQRYVDVPANDPNPPVVTWTIENLTTGAHSRASGAYNHALGDLADTIRVTVTAANPGGVRELSVTGWGQGHCVNGDNLDNPAPERVDLKPVKRSAGPDVPAGKAVTEFTAVYEFSPSRGSGPAGQPGPVMKCPESFLKKKGETYTLVCTADNHSGKQTASKLLVVFNH